MRSTHNGVRRLVSVALAFAILMFATSRAVAQDSVVILRGGRVVGAPSDPTTVAGMRAAERRPVGEVPEFLTPVECSRLVRFRDGELYRVAARAVTHAEVDADAEVDLTAIRNELSHTLTVAGWFELRDTHAFMFREVARVLRQAFGLTNMLAQPSGAPKTLAEIVLAIAKSGGEMGVQAVISGKTEIYRQRLNQASRDLDGAIRQLLMQSETVIQATDLRQARSEMDRLTAILPDLDRQIAAYRVAVRSANAELEGTNDELREIDTAIRRSCR